jgi:hypothetical protein
MSEVETEEKSELFLDEATVKKLQRVRVDVARFEQIMSSLKRRAPCLIRFGSQPS